MKNKAGNLCSCQASKEAADAGWHFLANVKCFSCKKEGCESCIIDGVCDHCANEFDELHDETDYEKLNIGSDRKERHAV